MVAAMLDAGGIDPTVINGGIINRYGSNARLGKRDWMVVEADESDGSFLRLDGTIAVVTNIDPEHLDHYGSFERVKDAFVEFVENVPFYGARRAVRRSSRGAEHHRPRCATGAIVTYGFSALADVRARQCDRRCRAATASTRRSSSATASGGRSRASQLPMPGPAQRPERAGRDRRRRSSLAFPTTTIVARLRTFDGVKRRFTKVGEVDGDDRSSTITRHHPVEIRAVLSAAREGAQGRVIAVVQPHRLHAAAVDLMEEFQNAFNDADIVFVTPVYAAGEEPIEGVDAAALVEGLRAHGHRMVRSGRRSRRALPRAARPCRRRRHGDLHGRRRHHQMGGAALRRRRNRPSRCARGGAAQRRSERVTRSGGPSAPPASGRGKVRGKLTANAPAGAARLVQERRHGRMAVRAGATRTTSSRSSAISIPRCR